jgi:hypothetical protein
MRHAGTAQVGQHARPKRAVLGMVVLLTKDHHPMLANRRRQRGQSLFQIDHLRSRYAIQRLLAFRGFTHCLLQLGRQSLQTASLLELGAMVADGVPFPESTHRLQEVDDRVIDKS